MSHQPQILLQKLNYKTPDNKLIIKDLTLSFSSQQKIAIVGKNGVGKSTLLKLIVGCIQPFSGKINLSGTISYCPQNFNEYLYKTVIEIFGLKGKITALENIERGSVDPKDFEIIGDDWNVKFRLIEQLKLFGLTRLWLAKVFFEKSDFIILDEPTNHLDLQSISELESALNSYQGALIVVSHYTEFIRNINATRIINLNKLAH